MSSSFPHLLLTRFNQGFHALFLLCLINLKIEGRDSRHRGRSFSDFSKFRLHSSRRLTAGAGIYRMEETELEKKGRKNNNNKEITNSSTNFVSVSPLTAQVPSLKCPRHPASVRDAVPNRDPELLRPSTKLPIKLFLLSIRKKKDAVAM